MIVFLRSGPKAGAKNKQPAEVPTLTLDELPDAITSPILLTQSRKTFSTAIDDKLDSWIIEGATDRKTRCEIFDASVEMFRDAEMLQGLPCTEVSMSAKTAAENLIALKAELKNWKVSQNLVEAKKRLSDCMTSWDEAFASLKDYEAVIEAVAAEAQQEETSRKVKINKLKTRLYQLLGRQNVPKCVNRVIDNTAVLASSYQQANWKNIFCVF